MKITKSYEIVNTIFHFKGFRPHPSVFPFLGNFSSLKHKFLKCLEALKFHPSVNSEKLKRLEINVVRRRSEDGI